MKKLLIILTFFLTHNLYAQYSHVDLEWEDPYTLPSSPGYEDNVKAIDAMYGDDTDTAILFYEKAAKKGSPFALTMLGRIYSNIDMAKAYQYLKKAADLEYAPAYYYLGKYFLNYKNNKLLAFQYYKYSADGGYPSGVRMLAYCYANGIGTNIDRNKAIRLYEPYALKDDIYSISAIGQIYYNDGDYENACKWLKRGAEQNDYNSLILLSYCYAAGLGVPVHSDTAHELLNRAEKIIDSDSDISQEEKEERHTNCLTLRGNIYMNENERSKAEKVWEQLKKYYPEYVEKNKYNENNQFISYMYGEDQKNIQLTNNTNIQSKPLVVSDIDEQIPENAISGEPVYAIIITNENYKEVEQVPHAIHDGETFKQYCEKTLGIPQNNIRFVEDATLNNIRRELNWISQVMDVYQGEASIIFYYAGHGIPDESNRTSYLLPVDGVGNDVSTGYSLDKLYADLSSKPAKSVVVLLDACFSGAKRDGGMLASTRGVAIKAKQNEPRGNMVVISAAQGDETAYPYEEKGHGMFTYYLLKKLQETKGDVTLGDLADYVTSEVKKRSVVVNGKMQTPIATASNNAADWRNWKLR